MKKDVTIVRLGGGENCMTISWAGRLDGPHPGFGVVMFWVDEKTGELKCNDEYMGEEFTHALIDQLKTAKTEY